MVIGEVDAGQTVEVEVPDDSRELYAKMDWGRSETYPSDGIVDGQTIYMNAWFTFNPLRNFGIWTMPMALEDEPR